MSEKKKDTLVNELNIDEMEKVAGGSPVFGRPYPCPNCHSTASPVWSEKAQRYVCPNPACQIPRGSTNPDVLKPV